MTVSDDKRIRLWHWQLDEQAMREYDQKRSLEAKVRFSFLNPYSVQRYQAAAEKSGEAEASVAQEQEEEEAEANKPAKPELTPDEKAAREAEREAHRLVNTLKSFELAHRCRL